MSGERWDKFSDSIHIPIAVDQSESSSLNQRRPKATSGLRNAAPPGELFRRHTGEHCEAFGISEHGFGHQLAAESKSVSAYLFPR